MSASDTSRPRRRRMTAASVNCATEYERYPVRGSTTAGTSKPDSWYTRSALTDSDEAARTARSARRRRRGIRPSPHPEASP